MGALDALDQGDHGGAARGEIMPACCPARVDVVNAAARLAAMPPSMPALASLLYAAMWLIGRLPLRALHALATPLAALVRRFGSREARVGRVNLRLCLPDLDATGREAMLRRAMAEMSRTSLETCAVWTRPAADTLRWVSEVDGAELFDAARAAGHGLIIAAPHLGNWEVLNVWLASRGDLAVVYRAPERAALEPLLRRARGHPGVEQLRAEPASVRRMLTLLRAGGTLGILPDQRPKAGEGRLAPLFDVPALTMTLLPKLARRTGATVLFAFAERLPEAAGFRIRILPAPARIGDEDADVALRALNQGIEAAVRQAPAQYQWTYKRYPSHDEQGRPRYAGHEPDPEPSRTP
ncbi:MAG: lipid A biosynthesis acyltransferase [Lysobacteraceae bacterium]